MASGDNTVYDNFLARTGLLDGHLITAALTTAAYLPSTTDTDLASITGEATGTGYARQTFTCSVLDHVCNVADADQWPAFNTSALAVHHNRVVLALGEDIDDGAGGTITEGTLISNILYGDQSPSSSWLAELVRGFAGPRRSPIVPVPTLDDAGKVLEVNSGGDYELTDTGELYVAELDTSAASAGQVLTVVAPGDPAEWADSAGGGSSYPVHSAAALISDFTGDGTGITTIDIIDQYGNVEDAGVARSGVIGFTVAVLSGTHNGGKVFTLTGSGAFTETATADDDVLVVSNPFLPSTTGLLVRQSGNVWVPFIPEPAPASVRHHSYSNTNVIVTVTDGVLTYNSVEHDVDDTPYTVELPSGDTIIGQTLTYKVGVDSGGTRPDLTFSAPFTGNVDHVFTTDKGGWNASTNTPTLANGTGTAGDYYTVTVAGTRNLGAGSDNYTVDEGVVYASGVWVHVQHGSIGHGRDYLLEQTWRLRQTGTLTFLKQGGGRWYLQAEDYDAKQKILFPEIDTGATTVEVVLQDYSELVLTEDTEITVTAFSEPGTITRLAIVQDGTGGWAVTWAGTSIAWVAGSEPTIDSAAAAKTLIYIAQIGVGLIGWPVVAPGGGGGGGSETTTTMGALIHGATGKTTPVDVDELGIVDSAASNILKKLTWANVKATLKSYFDTLYDPTGAADAVSTTSIGAVPTARTVNGHDLSANVTITASDVSAAPTTRTITAGTGLTGGGDLSANRTVAIDTSVVVDKTTAQTLTNKTLTAPAISSPTGIVKADVGLGSVTNDAQLKIASNLSDLANAGTARTNLGLAIGTDVAAQTDARFSSVPQNLGAGTTITASTHASLMPSTPTIYGVTGDLIIVRAEIRILNNTGSTQNADAVILKLGATTMDTWATPSLSTSASSRYTFLECVIPVGASNTTRGSSGKWDFDNLLSRRDRGASAVDLTSGVALDITGRTSTGTSEEIQLMWVTVARQRA